MKTSIPCVLMRAGTSRGPFFLREWLPESLAERDRALMAAMGSNDALQLDGVGGGNPLTSKAAIVARSNEPACDVDYLFAQVGIGKQIVDTRPNCGNMLCGVGPFAIEQGLVPITGDETTVRVYNVNTRSRVHLRVQTPGGKVRYAGSATIDGVSTPAAPIYVNFLDAAGGVTGALFPTGHRSEWIEGIEVTCIDAAMPLMILRAADMGFAGNESPATFDANAVFMAKLERMRLEAGRRMGLGDVRESVVPKPALISAGPDDDSLRSRYFTPWKCHAAHAVTGAIGLATALALPGTIASSRLQKAGERLISIHHPAGRLEVGVVIHGTGDDAKVESAALVRTARKIFAGEVEIG